MAVYQKVLCMDKLHWMDSWCAGRSTLAEVVTFGERWTHMVTDINTDNLEVLNAVLVQ